jgi:hypothetical protein
MQTAPSALRRAILVSSLALPLLVAACGGNATPSPATPSPAPSSAATATPTPSSAPVAVLLEVTSEGGFINPVVNLAALPAVVVYADGRVLMPGTTTPDAPAPLVQPVSIRDLGPAGAAAIQAAIQAAGLDQPATGDPGIAADAGTTVFAVTIGGKATVTTRFAAGGPGGPGLPGGGGGDNPEKTAAFDLLNRLLDTTDLWGAASAPESTYEPAGYRIFVAPGAPPADPSTSIPSIAWPLAASLADFGTPAVPSLGVTGLRSGVVLGADAQTLAPILATAPAGAAFTSNGASFTLYVRALLPHELPG